MKRLDRKDVRECLREMRCVRDVAKGLPCVMAQRQSWRRYVRDMWSWERSRRRSQKFLFSVISGKMLGRDRLELDLGWLLRLEVGTE